MQLSRFSSVFSALILGATVFGAQLSSQPRAAKTIISLGSNATVLDIQKALDKLPANGEVLLAPGTYEISQPILLRHDCETLRGSGLKTILHLSDMAGCPVVIIAPPLTQTSKPVKHLVLSSLLIDGNRQHQKLEYWKSAADGSEVMNNGIEVWNSTDVTIEHVACRRCRSGGLVTAAVRRLKVNDFDSYDNQFDGLACYETEQSQFEGLKLHDNLGAGISLDLAFNHNLIANAILAGNDLGIFMRHCRDNSFKGLTITHSHHHGVFMAQASAGSKNKWHLCPGTECADNNFANLEVDHCGGKAFQVNDASCINNIISQAKFVGNLLGGLCQPATNPVTLSMVSR